MAGRPKLIQTPLQDENLAEGRYDYIKNHLKRIIETGCDYHQQIEALRLLVDIIDKE